MHVRLGVDEIVYDVRLERDDTGGLVVHVDGEMFKIDALEPFDGTARGVRVHVEGQQLSVERTTLTEALVDDVPRAIRVEGILSLGGEEGIGAAGAAVRPPMPGKIVALHVHEGDVVAAGDVLLVLEAMKMQNEVVSPAAAVVRSVVTKVGANVDTGDVLVELGPVDGEPDGNVAPDAAVPA